MTQNSVNNAASSLTIDPGSDDSFVQFNINTTGEFRIGVDDTDDSFRIAQGSALGTNDTLIIEADGVRTWPLHCVAKYTNNTDRTNVTGDGTTYTMVFDSSRYDRNSNLSSSTTFTAPETGIYLVSGSIRLAGVTSSHTTGVIQFTGSTSAKTISSTFNPYTLDDANGTTFAVLNGLIALTAADTLTLDITISGGSLVVDSTGRRDSSFMSFYLAG